MTAAWKTWLDMMDVAVVVQNADHRIVYANEKATTLLGVSAEEITDRLVDDERWDVIDVDGKRVEEQGHPGVRAGRTGEPVHGRILGVRRGATSDRVWIMASAIPCFDEDGRVSEVVVTFSDIDEAQRGSREREATFRAVFGSIAEGIVVHSPDGTIRAANNAAERVLGLSIEQMSGRAATDPRWRLMKPDGSAVNEGDIPSEIARATGDAVPGRILGVHRPSGEVAWLSVRADPLREPGDASLRGVVATFSDVTEQRMTELALEASRAQVQRVLDTVPGLVYQYLHSRTGPARLSLVGGRVDALLGSFADAVRADPDTLFDLLGEEERTNLFARVEVAVRHAAPFEHEVSLVTADGELRWVRIQGTPEVTPEGMLYTGVVLDVTQTRRMADALRQTQRREAMGALAAGIAHNFNNMLAVIVPNIELAKEESSDAVRPMLADAERAAISAVGLVRRMLQLGRADQGAGVTVDFVPLVRETLQFCRQTFDRGIDIRTDIRVKRALVRGDASALQQVVLNLCINARDALLGSAQPLLEISLAAEGDDTVAMVVRDTGHGMSEDTLRRLGEPFFTTKTPGKGTGLGLATALQTISEAGGQWRVDSSPGQGTTFVVKLPVGERSGSSVPPPSALPRRADAAAILIIDDEVLVVTAIQRQLERAGFAVRTALDAAVGLELLRADRGREIRAIILDLSMPGRSGADLLPALKGVAPEVPVVVLSGHANPDVPLPLASAVLQKPIRTAQLVKALQKEIRSSQPPQDEPRPSIDRST